MRVQASMPSAELVLKIRQARNAVASQKKRFLQCPYCKHNSIIVF